MKNNSTNSSITEVLDCFISILQHISFIGFISAVLYVTLTIYKMGFGFPFFMRHINDPFVIGFYICVPLYFIIVILHVVGGRRFGIFGPYLHTFSFKQCMFYEFKNDLVHFYTVLIDFFDSLTEHNTWIKIRQILRLFFWGLLILIIAYKFLLLFNVIGGDMI